MPTMNLDQILERVQELKQESAEKDEVIRVQQAQIDELEQRIKDLEAQCSGLEGRIVELSESSVKAEELIEKLNSILG